MPRLTIYLARFIGLFLLIVSASMFLDPDSIIEMATALIDDRALLLIVGLIALGIGLAIVVGHNVWSGGLMPIVVTLFGWSQFLRGVALLFLPGETQVAWSKWPAERRSRPPSNGWSRACCKPTNP